MSGGQDVFRKGPIFTNVFLADEINRAAAHTQAALLEAMQERHVTSVGKTHWIESPFTVIATQNPFEHQGVFPLPESQLDRFIVKVPVGYPNAQQELEVLELPHRGTTTEVIGEINPILASGALLQEQERVDAVPVPTDVAKKIVDMVQYTRTASGVEMGASSRAGVHLYAAAKSRAYLYDHVAVTDDDVRAIAPLVLPHRMWAEDPVALVQDALRFAFGHSEAFIS
jgi:MoxR-like ATPase